MKKQLLLIGIACVLATGCKLGKKDDQKTPAPVAPANAPLGTFSTDPAAVAPDEKLADCMQNGFVIDPRLKAGQVFTHDIQFFPDVEGGPSATETTIGDISVNAGSVIATLRHLVPNHDIWYKELCLQSKIGGTEEACTAIDMSNELKNMPKEGGVELPVTTCFVVATEKPDEVKIEYGTYTFKDGRPVQAVKTTTVKSGPLNCIVSTKPDELSEPGRGTTTETEIKSIEVPETRSPYAACGQTGSVIYHFKDGVKEDGTVLSVYKAELQSATP
jgi:hypothetical protein